MQRDLLHLRMIALTVQGRIVRHRIDDIASAASTIFRSATEKVPAAPFGAENEFHIARRLFRTGCRMR